MKFAVRRCHARLAAWMVCAGIALAGMSAHATPQSGWWWNPAESGRGFFLEVQGPRMFMAGYFYADDGRPTWLVSNDLMPDPNAYDARLLSVTGGQTLVGDYHAPSVPVDAGPVSLRFSDDRRGTLTWAGGTIAIERYAFQHGADATLQPKTGWWWNPDENGRGFSVELQGDHMFIGAYMYDTDGMPVWYVADALMESPGVFRGPLYHVANGQTMGGSYRPPSAPTIAGSVRMEFSAPDRATVTLTDDHTLAAKTSKTIVILPQYVLHPVGPMASAKFWVGGFDWKRVFTFDDVVNEFAVDVPIMTWSQPVDLDTGRYPAFYKRVPVSRPARDRLIFRKETSRWAPTGPTTRE